MDDYLQKCPICRKELKFDNLQYKLDLEKILIRLSIICYFYFYFQLFFNDVKEKDFSFEKFWSKIYFILMPFILIQFIICTHLLSLFFDYENIASHPYPTYFRFAKSILFFYYTILILINFNLVNFKNGNNYSKLEIHLILIITIYMFSCFYLIIILFIFFEIDELILFFLKKIFKIHFSQLKNIYHFFLLIAQPQNNINLIKNFFINIFFWFTMQKNYQLNAKKIQ